MSDLDILSNANLGREVIQASEGHVWVRRETALDAMAIVRADTIKKCTGWLAPNFPGQARDMMRDLERDAERQARHAALSSK